MKEKLIKRFIQYGLHVFSAISMESLAESVVEELAIIAKEFPNDASFGEEMRKLINE